jgi:transposase
MDEQTNQVGAGPGEAERAPGSVAVALGRGGRMSRQRKSAAVLRLLRGEDLETVSRELGVMAATLTGWHDAFLAGGEAALTSRAATGEELESERLKAKLGAALIERDLLNEKIALLEAGRPFARAGASHEPRPVAGHRQTLRLGRGLPCVAARPLGCVSPPVRLATGAAARAARCDVG